MKFNIKNKYRSNIFSIALASILLSLSILFEFFGNYIVIWTGFSVEIHLVFYLITICMFWRIRDSLFIIIVSPILWLLTPGEYMVHPIQFFIEYILCNYVFMIILINYKFVIKSEIKLLYFFYFIFLIIISYIIKLFLHILCGVLWWNTNWIGSILLNSQTIGISITINIPLIIMVIIPCIKIKNNYKLLIRNKWS